MYAEPVQPTWSTIPTMKEARIKVPRQEAIALLRLLFVKSQLLAYHMITWK